MVENRALLFRNDMVDVRWLWAMYLCKKSTARCRFQFSKITPDSLLFSETIKCRRVFVYYVAAMQKKICKVVVVVVVVARLQEVCKCGFDVLWNDA